MNADMPFPTDLWRLALEATVLALSRTVRWLYHYEPPPGEAVRGEVTITAEKEDKHG